MDLGDDGKIIDYHDGVTKLMVVDNDLKNILKRLWKNIVVVKLVKMD